MNIANSKRLTHAGRQDDDGGRHRQRRSRRVLRSRSRSTDAGGHLILLERMEGGRFHTVHSSTTKAVCAASNKRPTSAKGAVGQDLDTSACARPRARRRCRALDRDGRRLPVIVDGECIGGVGVAGADWQTDERIAHAAVEAIGASWK